MKNLNVPFRKTSRAGFSIIEVLVGVAILGILMFAVASVIESQTNQLRSVAQKSEVRDLKANVAAAMATAACTCVTNGTDNTTNAYPLTFNSTLANLSARRIQLSSLTGGCDSANHPTLPLVTENTLVPNTQTLLRVSQISITNLQPVGSATPNIYQGVFEIDFAQSGSVQKQPILITSRFNVDLTTPTATKIVSCIASTTLNATFNSQTFKVAGTYSFVVPPGVTSLYIRAVGAGAGGAGEVPLAASPFYGSGGGGGSGGYAEGWLAVAGGNTYSIVVGKGGAGGTGGGDNFGIAGTTTTFDTYLSASGGQGGAATSLGDFGGGAPGAGAGGQVVFYGGWRGDGNSSNAAGGSGGGTAFGGGGRGAQSCHGPSDALAPGSGGGASWGGLPPYSLCGGNGADGAVILSW